MKIKKEKILFLLDGQLLKISDEKLGEKVEIVTKRDGRLMKRVCFDLVLDYQTIMKINMDQNRMAFEEIQNLTRNIDTQLIEDPELRGLIEATTVVLDKWGGVFKDVAFLRKKPIELT